MTPGTLHTVPSIPDQPAHFLAAVWAGMLDECLLALAVNDEKKNGRGLPTRFVKMLWGRGTASIPDLVKLAKKRNELESPTPDVGSVYWHGAARKETVGLKLGARGGLSDLTYVGSFWCDLDVLKHGYSYEQGIQTLLSMPIRPSMILFSGGGLQAVHLLDRPMPVPDRAAALEYRAMSIGLYRPIFLLSGLNLDESVHEASRMMRLPGFINRKPERAGAVAQLLYFDPSIRHPLKDIETYTAGYRNERRRKNPPPSQNTSATPAPDGTFTVGRGFIEYTINGLVPPERHPVLLRLAGEARAAGMTADQVTAVLRPLARAWFLKDDPSRAEGELDRMITWVFSQDQPDSSQAGGAFSILVENGKVSLAPTDAQERRKLPAPLPPESQPTTPKSTAHIGLSALRRLQEKEINAYLDSNVSHGSYLLLRTSPGAGKTYAVWQALAKRAVVRRAAGKVKPFAVVLSAFKSDEANLKAYYEEQGIDPDLVFYFAGRTADPKSKGFCAKSEHADILGHKQYPIKSMLCAYCPLKNACEQGGYLKQFEDMKRYPIIHARHQHAAIDELTGGKKILFFDESPLDVIAAPLELKSDDLRVAPPRHLGADFREPIRLINDLLATIRALLETIPKIQKGQWLSSEHMRLGGKWFFDQLDMRLGSRFMPQLLAIPEAVIKEIASPSFYWDENDPDGELKAFKALPANFLPALHRLLSDEYARYQSLPENATAWNSRIACFAQRLHLFPLDPLIYPASTKIIAADATGNPDQYQKIFKYQKKGELLPFTGKVFDPQLTPRAKVTQLVGTDNTRAALRPRPDPDNWSEEQPQWDQPPAVKKAKLLILDLIAKHKGSLLVVTYKKTAENLRVWLKQAAPNYPASYVQWFGGLRGKNDFKHLEAVFIFGTPRIPVSDVLIEAMIWHHDDPALIMATPAQRMIPYTGIDLAYPILSYADDRVHYAYVHRISAEMRQCYERIRPNASPEKRFVYLGSGFPCADHVDELIRWSAFGLKDLIRRAVPEQGILWRALAVKQLMDMGDISRTYAYEKFDEFLKECRETGEFEIVEEAGKFGLRIAHLSPLEMESLKADPTKADRIKSVLRSAGGWGGYSIREMQKRLNKLGMKVSIGTLQRIKKELDAETRAAAYKISEGGINAG